MMQLKPLWMWNTSTNSRSGSPTIQGDVLACKGMRTFALQKSLRYKLRTVEEPYCCSWQVFGYLGPSESVVDLPLLLLVSTLSWLALAASRCLRVLFYKGSSLFSDDDFSLLRLPISFFPLSKICLVRHFLPWVTGITLTQSHRFSDRFVIVSHTHH